MKENLTSINVIIDSSGSMQRLTLDTIGGFNQFLKEQKEAPGDALFSLCLFNTHYELIHDCVPLSEVQPLNIKTYRPTGGTALLEAIGRTIDEVGKKLSLLAEEERPSKVLFLIMTDGEENASKRYTEINQIKDMVSHQQEKYNWLFVFVGANIDAISTGKGLGVSMQNSLNYSATSDGTKGLYDTLSRSTTRYRSVGTNQSDFFGKIDPFSPSDDGSKGSA